MTHAVNIAGLLINIPPAVDQRATHPVCYTEATGRDLPTYLKQCRLTDKLANVIALVLDNE